MKRCESLGNVESSDKMNGGVELFGNSTTGMSGSRVRGEADACTEPTAK